MITIEQYFGPYQTNADANSDMHANALELLDRVNSLLSKAAADGIEEKLNPNTDSQVSGNGNGGFRPSFVTVGAKHSKHRTAQAVDLYDPERAIARWCLRNKKIMSDLGLHMENPQWTPTWCHLQNVPPRSGMLVFVPSSDPPLAPPLPEQAA